MFIYTQPKKHTCVATYILHMFIHHTDNPRNQTKEWLHLMPLMQEDIPTKLRQVPQTHRREDD